MFESSKLSLKNIFSTILILVIVFSITILLILNYTKQKNKLYLHLEETSQITLQRLTRSLVPFIESYSVHEYTKLIKTEMGDPDILAIIIKDEQMGKILGEENYFVGIIRDKEWNTTEYKELDKKILQNSFLKVNGNIMSSTNQNMAEVNIYFTDQFIQKELKALTKESIIALIIISFIMLLVLFVTLHNFILKPIFTIVDSLRRTDTYGLPIEQLPDSPTIELSNLSSKINSMITEIRSSKNTLNQYIERYELTLDGINDGIWDWNIKDNSVYFSKRWKNILDYEEDQFENTPEAFFNAIYEEDKQKVQEALQKHFENPEKNIYNIELRIKTKNNSYKWILTRGKAILDEQGTPIRMVGSHTDIEERKQEENKLKQVLQQLQLAKKIGKLGVWEKDHNTNSVYWSSELYELIGLDNTTIPSYEKFLSCIHSSDRSGVEEIFQSQKKNQELEFRLLLEDHTIRYVKAFITTLYNEKNIPLKDIGVLYDISDIQKERNFISTIINNANAIIAVIDSDGVMFKLNKYAQEFTGYTQEEVASEAYFWTRFLDEKKKDKIVDIIKKAKEGEITKSFKNSWFSKTGQKRVFEWSNTLVQKEDGTMDYLVSIGIDISKKEEIQQQIAIQKKEFESIFTYAQDGIIITDLHSNFLTFNDAYLHTIRYTKEELLQNNCINLIAHEDQKKLQNLFQSIIEKKHVDNFEITSLTKDGQRVEMNMSLSLLPDLQRVLIITKDITSLKLLEEQSKLASMGEMIGNIAHQWRQPLSIITTSASGLKLQSEMGILNQENIDKYNDLIVQQADYLSKTIDNFRDFIKGETTYKNLSVHELIVQTLDLVKASLDNNYIKTSLKIDEDMFIYGNITELTQALLNIINNAKDILKDTIPIDQERVILINTKKIDEQTLELNIKDNGGGIKEDIIHRIFEPYFTTKHQSIGTGLGLSMVDKIIRERHSFVVKVHNEQYKYNGNDYKGACFTILFKAKSSKKIS